MAERLPGILESSKRQEATTGQIPDLGARKPGVKSVFNVPADKLKMGSSEARGVTASGKGALRWVLPQKRSVRLVMATASVCVLAAIAILAYPADFAGVMLGTAKGSGLESGLIFFLGAVAGGAAVGIFVR